MTTIRPTPLSVGVYAGEVRPTGPAVIQGGPCAHMYPRRLSTRHWLWAVSRLRADERAHRDGAP